MTKVTPAGARFFWGRHICYQLHFAQLAVDLLEFLVAQLRSVDGVVGGNVHVISVLRNLVVRGDERVVLVRATGHFHCFAEALGLFECFLGPNTCVQVCSLLLQQIIGQHAELQACAAAKENDAVALRNAQQLFHQCFGFVHYGLEILGSVRDLQNTQAVAFKIEYGFSRLFDYFLRQDARSCIEIILLNHSN